MADWAQVSGTVTVGSSAAGSRTAVRPKSVPSRWTVMLKTLETAGTRGPGPPISRLLPTTISRHSLVQAIIDMRLRASAALLNAHVSGWFVSVLVCLNGQTSVLPEAASWIVKLVASVGAGAVGVGGSSLAPRTVAWEALHLRLQREGVAGHPLL